MIRLQRVRGIGVTGSDMEVSPGQLGQGCHGHWDNMVKGVQSIMYDAPGVVSREGVREGNNTSKTTLLSAEPDNKIANISSLNSTLQMITTTRPFDSTALRELFI